MELEVVAVGNELLLGFTTDTNSAFLARELSGIGVSLVRKTVVGDALEDIGEAVLQALDRTGFVVTTGGLGPTDDDLTREAVAAALGVTLQEDQEWITELENRYGERGRTLNASNRRQAMAPEGAVLLHNAHGSAPGLWIDTDRGTIVMLPGVPWEVKYIVRDQFLPRLKGKAGSISTLSRTLRTTGIPESDLQEMMTSAEFNPGPLTMAYLPSAEGVDIRLTAWSQTIESGLSLIDETVTRLSTLLGKSIYGRDEDDLAAVVIDALRSQGRTIAVAESCTGGMLGTRLTAVPGSSKVFAGGVIAYSNGVKEGLLDVSRDSIAKHGAVSEEVAGEMAIGVMRRLGTDYGVGITGVAGPDGGTPEKPVGTVWIAVARRGRISTRGLSVPGDRDWVRRRSTQTALGLVWTELSGGTAPAI